MLCLFPELALPEDVTASATFFHLTYSNLTDLTATCDAGQNACSIVDRASGRAFGLELMIARPLSKRLGGLVSYTLSRSERTASGETFTADFDRTHVLHAVVGYALGRGFQAAARVTAYSGRPHSLLVFDVFDDPDDPTLVGKRNAQRRPAFYPSHACAASSTTGRSAPPRQMKRSPARSMTSLAAQPGDAPFALPRRIVVTWNGECARHRSARHRRRRADTPPRGAGARVGRVGPQEGAHRLQRRPTADPPAAGS